MLSKTGEDAIVSPLLVIILGLKTLGFVLKKTNELTNMTEKEDGNGKRNSQVCTGSKNGLAARFMKHKWQVLGLSWINTLLKVKTYLSLQSTQNRLLLMQPPALTHNHIYSPYLMKTLILCLELQYFNKD